MTEASQQEVREEIPAAPPGYPTADPAAVERARTDGGLRLRLVRALRGHDDLPTPYAQLGGYIYELADRAASEIEGAAGPHTAPARVYEPLEALKAAEQRLAQLLGTRWQPAPWEINSKSEVLHELSQILQDMRDGINRARRPEPEPRVHEPMRADVPGELFDRQAALQLLAEWEFDIEQRVRAETLRQIAMAARALAAQPAAGVIRSTAKTLRQFADHLDEEAAEIARGGA